MIASSPSHIGALRTRNVPMQIIIGHGAPGTLFTEVVGGVIVVRSQSKLRRTTLQENDDTCYQRAFQKFALIFCTSLFVMAN